MGPETVSDLFAALYKRRLTIFLVLAGSLVGAYLFLEMIPREWKAVAAVFIQSNPSRLSLHSSTANIPSGPIVPDTRLETALGLLGVASGGQVHQRVAERIPGVDARILRKNLILDTDRFKQLNITAYDRKKERAVQFANEARQAIIDMLRENAEMAPRANLALFNEELVGASARHDAAQNALIAYLDRIDTPDLEVSVSRLFSDRARYLTQLEGLDREERQIQAERPVIEGILGDRPEFQISSYSINRNAVHAQLVSRLAELETSIALLRMEVTDEHPSLKALVTQQGIARDQLNEQLEMIQTGTSMRLDDQTRTLVSELIQFVIKDASRDSRREAFRRLLDSVENQLGEVPLNRTELANLEEEANRTSKLVDDLKNRIYEIELQLVRGLDFTWSDSSRMASTERAGQVPGKGGVFLFASIGGLIAGVLLSLGMELISQMRRQRPF